MKKSRLMRKTLGVMPTAMLSLAAFADILPENAFWNKDTAYQPAAPATSAAKSLESEEDFSFTSTWELSLLFLCDFHGNPVRGLLYYVQ